MNSTELLTRTEELWNKLTKESVVHNRMTYGNIAEIQKELLHTDAAIKKLKAWVLPHEFDDWKTEIEFFKQWKPKFVAHFIQLMNTADFLATTKQFNEREDKKLRLSYLKKIKKSNKKLNRLKNYLSKNQTFRDKEYYLRFHYEILNNNNPHFHSLDHKFTTLKDHQTAQLIANDRLMQFLTANHKAISSNRQTSSKLTWSASKAALTELIFALHHTHCINGGAIELSVIVRHFEHLFNTTLGNYHKTIGEIKLRKSETTKFLGILKNNLSNHIEESDAYRP